MKDKLPSNWTIINVGSLCAQLRGITYQKGDAYNAPFKNSVWVLRGGNIQDGKIVTKKNDDVYVSNKLVKKEQLIRKGDVIIVSSTGSKALVGKAAHAVNDLVNAGFGAFLTLLRPTKEIDSLYFNYFFQTEYYRENIRQLSGGININNIRRNHIHQLEFPLAPLAEQKRISKKLEEIFGHVHVLNARLDRIPEMIKAFKAKVLTYAVTGKLTQEWRKKNGNAENGHDLLNSLIQIRSEKYQRQLEDSKEKSTPKPRRPILEIASVEDNFFDIPNTWALTNFETAAEKIFDGTHFSPNNFPKGQYKYVTAKNIKEWGIDLSTVTYVDETIHKKIYSRADVKLNDVLYIKDGATTGIATLNTLDEEFSLLSSVGVFRFNEEFILPKFIVYFLNGVKQKMISNVSGIAITRLTLEKLNAATLVIPPIEEQKEIVRRVDELFHFAVSIESYHQENKAKVDTLPQSILAKAFRGELVSQNENDEPANVLLERIKGRKSHEKLSHKPGVKTERNQSRIKQTKILKSFDSMDLVEIIRSSFKEKHFTYEDLNKVLAHKSKSEYIATKRQFFALLRNEKLKKKETRLISELGDTGLIKYKLVQQ